jgi:hypothetical protein
MEALTIEKDVNDIVTFLKQHNATDEKAGAE